MGWSQNSVIIDEMYMAMEVVYIFIISVGYELFDGIWKMQMLQSS